MPIADEGAVERASEGQDEAIAKARRLFDTAPFAYVVTTSSGVVIEANDATGILLDILPHRLLKKSITVAVSLPDRQAFRQRMCQCVDGDDVMPWSLTISPRVSPSVVCTATCRRGNVDGQLVWTFHPLADPAVDTTKRRIELHPLDEELAVALQAVETVDEILDRMLRRFVASHADFCMIELLGREDMLIRCAVSHAEVSRHPSLATFINTSSQVHIRDEMFTARGTIEPMTDEAASMLSANAAEHEVWRELALASFFRTPLMSEGRLIGAATLGWCADRAPSRADVDEMYRAVDRASTFVARALDRDVDRYAVEGANATLRGLTRDLAPVLDAILGHAALLTTSGNGGSGGNGGIGNSIANGIGSAASIDLLRAAALHAQALNAAAIAESQRECVLVPVPDLDVTQELHEAALILGPLAAANRTRVDVVTPATRLYVRADSLALRRVLIYLLDQAIHGLPGSVVRISARARDLGVTFTFAVDSPRTAAAEELFESDAQLERYIREALNGSIEFSRKRRRVRVWVPAKPPAHALD
jgi:signal transduction histidine kinase